MSANRQTKSRLAICWHILRTVAIAFWILAASFAVLQQDSSTVVAQTASIRYVESGGDCGTASPCYSSIQTAVDAAQPLDEIRIAGGTYSSVQPRFDIQGQTMVTQVVHITKTLSLQGGYTRTNWLNPNPLLHPTIVTSNGQGRGIYIGGQVTVSVTGLTVSLSNALDQVVPNGGGVIIDGSSATFSNTIFTGNSAQNGGGLYNSGGVITLLNSNIYGNSATLSGGGVYITTTLGTNIISATQFVSNGAYVGGGLSSRGHTEISKSRFFGNIVALQGGGLVVEGGDITLRDSTISRNWATNAGITFPVSSGSGLAIKNANAQMINNMIVANEFAYEGALSIYCSTINAVHTTFAHYDGMVIYTYQYCPSTLVLTNTIISYQLNTLGVSAFGADVTMNSTLWEAQTAHNATGNVVRINDYYGNPSFVSVPGNDFRLSASSPAIDQGINAGANIDFEGDPRPLQNGFDLGADEFTNRSYLPLLIR